MSIEIEPPANKSKPKGECPFADSEHSERDHDRGSAERKNAEDGHTNYVRADLTATRVGSARSIPPMPRWNRHPSISAMRSRRTSPWRWTPVSGRSVS